MNDVVILSPGDHGTHACRPDTDILVPVFSPIRARRNHVTLFCGAQHLAAHAL